MGYSGLFRRPPQPTKYFDSPVSFDAIMGNVFEHLLPREIDLLWRPETSVLRNVPHRVVLYYEEFNPLPWRDLAVCALVSIEWNRLASKYLYMHALCMEEMQFHCDPFRWSSHVRFIQVCRHKEAPAICELIGCYPGLREVRIEYANFAITHFTHPVEAQASPQIYLTRLTLHGIDNFDVHEASSALALSRGALKTLELEVVSFIATPLTLTEFVGQFERLQYLSIHHCILHPGGLPVDGHKHITFNTRHVVMDWDSLLVTNLDWLGQGVEELTLRKVFPYKSTGCGWKVWYHAWRRTYSEWDPDLISNLQRAFEQRVSKRPLTLSVDLRGVYLPSRVKCQALVLQGQAVNITVNYLKVTHYSEDRIGYSARRCFSHCTTFCCHKRLDIALFMSDLFSVLSCMYLIILLFRWLNTGLEGRYHSTA